MTRTRVVATVFGIAVAAFCGYELHQIIGEPPSRKHDLLMAGLAGGCLLAFSDFVLPLWHAVAPYLPFLKKPNGGGGGGA